MISEENIPQRSDSYSALFDVCRASVKVAFDNLLSVHPFYHNYFGRKSEVLIEKANFLYVLIVDWKEYWEDI